VDQISPIKDENDELKRELKEIKQQL
jgi:chromosome segregation ATPase